MAVDGGWWMSSLGSHGYDSPTHTHVCLPTSDRVKELEAAKVSARYEERPGLVSFAGFARRRSTTSTKYLAGPWTMETAPPSVPSNLKFRT